MTIRSHAHNQSIVFALLLLSLGARAQDASSHLSTRVDSIATAVLASTGVPSATVAVVTHGKVAYAKAYGDAKLDPRVAATPDMRYGIGSISKQFTAACVLLLQQDGKLKLDDPVSKYVPGLTRGNDVTIRQILSHTSGYQDFWPQDYVPPAMEKAIAPQAILDHWAKQPLDFEPGTRWQYSNTNFAIAALVVEKASGKPFFQFVRARILDPLGITTAVDFDALGPTSVQPVGYMRYGLGPLRPATPTGPGWMYGAGELAMTASDLAKWDIAMINQSLLKPESYRQMETTVLLKSGVSADYGLGVDVGMSAGHRTIEHSGEVAGFTAENIVYPDDSAAVIVLTNQDAAPASSLIGYGIARTLFTTEDADTQKRTARARAIFDGLQHGTIDRSVLTLERERVLQRPGAHRLSDDARPARHTQRLRADRAARARRDARARVPRHGSAVARLRVWTYEMPDGKLEQYQLAPAG